MKRYDLTEFPKLYHISPTGEFCKWEDVREDTKVVFQQLEATSLRCECEVKANQPLRDGLENARVTAEYWKAEHIAGNKRIAWLEAENTKLREALDRILNQTTTLQVHRNIRIFAKEALEGK